MSNDEDKKSEFDLDSYLEGKTQLTPTIEEKNETGPWPSIVLFILLVGLSILVFGVLFVRYAIGASMSAGSGGGNGLVLVLIGFIASLAVAAYISFKK